MKHLKIAAVLLLVAAAGVTAVHGQEQTWSHAHVGKKTVLLPFRHIRSRLGDFTRVNKRLAVFLEHQGMLVVNRDRIEKAFWRLSIDPRTTDLTPAQLQYLAQHFGADLLVTGEIIDFRSQKKFRLTNLLMFPPGLGYILYGTVSLSVRVYDAHTGKTVYANAVEHRGKNQIGGLYQNPSSVLDRVLNTAILDLFDEFFHPVEETYQPQP